MADLGLGELLVGLNPKDADQAFVKTKPLFIAKKTSPAPSSIYFSPWANHGGR
jgi:hypothetical protein